MVRMSDLVRGTARPAPAGPAPAPAPGAAPPPPRRLDPAPEARAPGAARAAAAARDAATAAPDGAATEAAEELFGELVRFLEGVRDLVKTSRPLAWADLQRLVEAALGSLEASGELFWAANRAAIPPGVDYLAFHQARVAVLAMRVGADLGLARSQLIELGLAGCLIDIGLWQLPPALVKRLEALSGEEQQQYRGHPRLAADAIRRWAPPAEGLLNMVLHHHEREQGQGFPQGLSGAAIHPEAKILGLVDTYTGLTAPASLRPGLRPYEAVREIVRSKHEAFPPALIKVLLNEITVFPPGTLVRLNSGEIGCVIAVNRNHPLRPRLEIYDARGHRVPSPKLVDLSEAPFLYITGALAESGR
jgi:HD-GYP domain-containing protein (c-di-GMP phosphodiesterase class II)